MASSAKVLFADAAVERLERDLTLPAKYERLLKRLQVREKVAGKNVAIKMHLGRDIGYTTIAPVFVRLLVKAVKEGGAASIKIIDDKIFANDEEIGVGRGYTPEVVGCPIVPCFGRSGKYHYKEPIGFNTLDSVELAGEAVDCDMFIDLSHIKGHGQCGFGGALKNIAMGLVTRESRAKIHSLEGGLTIDPEKCAYCLKCFKACPNNAIVRDDEKKEVSFFFHHCTYCQHCVMICPEKAITVDDQTFENFAHGMAKVTASFLKKFEPENLLFINILTQITMYCDCWGMSSPALVPDIGIVAGEDLTAVDTASLDMIKAENLLANGLPKNKTLLEGDRHLFERIHGKDPYLMLTLLQKYYDCSTEYEVAEVK